MASTVSSEWIRTNIYVRGWAHINTDADPALVSPDNGTTIRYVDMRDFLHFGFGVSRISGSAVTLTQIVASTEVTFASPIVIKDSGVLSFTTTDDWRFLECTGAEVSTLGANLRYLAGRISTNAANSASAVYVGVPKNRDLNTTLSIDEI